MEIKVEVLDTRMINGHLIELEHWSTTAANPEHSLSKYTVHDRIYYALGHIIKELSTPKFVSESEARKKFDECILEYSKFDVGGPQAIKKNDRVLTTDEFEIGDQYYTEFINLNTNWEFSNFTINKFLTKSEDDTTVNCDIIINGDKFIGSCHLYDFERSDDTIITNDDGSININLNDYMDNVDRIGRYPGFFEKNYGVSDELLRDTIISKVKAFLRGEDSDEF
jgi:hypothetical protein